MSRGRAIVATLVALFAGGSVGCWEQWSEDWFPQMKWQKAVQAYERTMHDGKVDLFLPPEGTVPVSGGVVHFDPNDDEAANALVNPRKASLESLENGRAQYETQCAACHGIEGLGNGPVSMTGPIQGPFAGVLAVAGPASIARVRSDGHIYTTIRYGRRRMPSYQRIRSDDRWDIVNYIRYMNGQQGVAAVGGGTQ
ncbi:MAG: cytochrome c [Myxococcota bacterium]|nr:cytochrome c [Myxococcota bacterium]